MAPRWREGCGVLRKPVTQTAKLREAHHRHPRKSGKVWRSAPSRKATSCHHTHGSWRDPRRRAPGPAAQPGISAPHAARPAAQAVVQGRTKRCFWLNSLSKTPASFSLRLSDTGSISAAAIRLSASAARPVPSPGHEQGHWWPHQPPAAGSAVLEWCTAAGAKGSLRAHASGWRAAPRSGKAGCCCPRAAPACRLVSNSRSKRVAQPLPGSRAGMTGHCLQMQTIALSC